METKNINHDKIELRSEKVRNLIGENPPILIRWGTTILVIVFIVLILVICFFPYPYSNGETILQHFIT